MIHDDEYWMKRAVGLARQGLGETEPNPAVGALLVRGDTVLGEGWHERAGLPHAEANAIRMALSRGFSLEGATLYVTLEPCSTYGRTPPCTDLILAHRPARVVIGTIDPYPKHQGRAYGLLWQQGIEVVTGVLEADCRGINPAFHERYR